MNYSFFHIDSESSDKLNEFFASENGFALQRLLSEVNANDINLEFNELIKFDSTKLLDSRTLSEFVSGKKNTYEKNFVITHRMYLI